MGALTKLGYEMLWGGGDCRICRPHGAKINVEVISSCPMIACELRWSIKAWWPFTLMMSFWRPRMRLQQVLLVLLLRSGSMPNQNKLHLNDLFRSAVLRCRRMIVKLEEVFACIKPVMRRNWSRCGTSKTCQTNWISNFQRQSKKLRWWDLRMWKQYTEHKLAQVL